jgi:Na+-translocating ferredoxin:NAD+ oxidoreductase RNF subunit RnfB
MTKKLLELNFTFPTIARLLPGCGVGGCGFGGCGLLD